MTPNEVNIYTTYVGLQNLAILTLDAGGNQVGFSYVNETVVGTGGQTLQQHDNTLQFIQPYVLNAVDPTRMFVGTNFLYESFDQGNDFNVLNGGNSLGTTAPNGLVYGGYLNGVGNKDIAIVGTNNLNNFSNPSNTGGVFLRTTAGGAFNQLTSYPGGPVKAITVDPTNWQHLFVADANGNVYVTYDAQDLGNSFWFKISGNIGSLAKELDGTVDLRTLTVYNPTGQVGDAVLLLGGSNGVLRFPIPASAAARRLGRRSAKACPK